MYIHYQLFRKFLRYYKVQNVLALLVVTALRGVMVEEAIMMVEEEEVLRQEEEVLLAAEVLINLLRVFIQDPITIIIAL